MGFSLIWPIAFSVLAGVIIIMYLLKQHAKEVKVPSLFLWSEMYKNQTSDRPWEKLKKNILLVLEVITMLILVLALMGPYIKLGKSGGTTVFIVIDSSASMGTRYKGSATRLDAAINDAENYVKSLPEGTKVAVIESSNEASVLLAATPDKNAVVKTIRSVRQTMRRGSCEAGVKTARALYNAYDDGAVVLFTDTYSSIGEMNGSIYDYSGIAENCGITYVFSEGNGDDTYLVAAGITNYGSMPASMSVDLYEVKEDGTTSMVTSKDVTVEAGEVLRVTFEDVTIDTPGMAVGIDLNDDYAFDNMYYAAREVKKEASVLMFTKGNTFLEKAIGLVEGVGKPEKAQSDAGFSASSGYTLYVIDCMGEVNLSDLPTDGNILVIGSGLGFDMTRSEGAVTLTGENAYGSYSLKVGNTFFYDVPKDCTPVFKCNEGAAAFKGTLNGRKAVVVGFDFHSTDFTMTSEFPIFIYDVVKELTDTSPVDRGNITPGETVRVALSGLSESYIVTPGGSKVKVGMVDNFSATDRMGCYTVKGEDGDDSVFTVNADVSESFTGIMNATEHNADIKAGGSTGSMNLRTLIIAIAAMMLLVEWFFYIRQ